MGAFIVLCICGICRHRRRVGQGMTVQDADGRVVQIHGCTKGKSKSMRRTDFEAKVGKYGWDKADKDGSGQISKREWLTLFDEVDTNGDGEISQDEWEAAFGPGTFEAWDVNHDGAINAKEWAKIYVSKIGARGREMNGGKADGKKTAEAPQVQTFVPK